MQISEMHWQQVEAYLAHDDRAVLPLGSTERHHDCVMENILGADQEKASALLSEPDLLLHLYGKAEARPGRKMGHFTRLYPLSAGAPPLAKELGS